MIHQAVSRELATEPFAGTAVMIEEAREISKMLGALIGKLTQKP